MTTSSDTELIRRLEHALQVWECATSDGPPDQIPCPSTLLVEARARLAQPEPQGAIPEAELAAMWNQQADAFNQWESLDSGEQLAWAQAQALARWGRPASPQ